MRVLVDQDVYQLTVDQLRKWRHDVVTAREIGLQRAPDEDLLLKAREMRRLLVTRDKGFGAVVFLKRELSVGVLLLRVSPSTIDDVHGELKRVFEEHSQEELGRFFCVVEPHRHRMRRLH
ncbi:MAG: DUF5615 family PIN-like protein [bacterium]|jgi:predicted nuclease of predicted toxin-antitoxin system|nr:DUF5615 family PIN-like protein [candidate division KSB1 bacterium]MDH7561657.1 DUF5615 family PIN-like protein [bacterium]